jgi:tetratricopeptide (TPR) repeat protein
MFFSSSIPPADSPGGEQTGQRLQLFTAIFLLVVWVLLMTFGVISVLSPPWLEKLSSPGRVREAADYKNYGDKLLKQRNYPLAIRQYQQALEIDPEQVDAAVNMAVARVRSGDFTSGIQGLEKILQRHPQREEVIYFNLGELYSRNGDQDRALTYYRHALDSEIDPAVVYRRMGALHLEKGYLDSALQDFRHSLAAATDPATPLQVAVKRSLGIYLEDSLQLARLRDLSREPPDLSPYDVELIRYLQQQDRETAKDHNYLGLIFARKGELDSARTHFQESLKIWPHNQDAVRNLKVLAGAGKATE